MQQVKDSRLLVVVLRDFSCLVDLFDFTVNTFKKVAGRRLTTIECHDIVCKIAEIVVVGGVRILLLSHCPRSWMTVCVMQSLVSGG